MTLAQPNSDFPAALSIPQAGIICPAGLADKAALAAGPAKGAFSAPYALSLVTARDVTPATPGHSISNYSTLRVTK
ncbi:MULTISPECIES: hypothetical protein [Amycolatopsis]|uniref:Uncharacterized protein n=1 Tax=Amycolatopsis albidoflavus TaxID=102226 RepID=A0ABW5HT81_9PSEU